jgi:hypothetical protein
MIYIVGDGIIMSFVKITGLNFDAVSAHEPFIRGHSYTKGGYNMRTYNERKFADVSGFI